MRIKKFFKTIALIMVVAVTAVAITACTKTDREYFNKVAAYSFWNNKGENSLAQYKLFNHMDDFLTSGNIQDGKCIDEDGKTRKVLFLGWDGVRADALTNIFQDTNDFETNGYNYEITQNSGLHTLKQRGGVYMAYAGGEKGKASEQQTSTCAGWTSTLTGAWSDVHGVKTNDDIKSKDSQTLMLKYAKLGLNTGFAFDWGQIFDTTFREDVSYLLQNPNTPMIYRDIDRPIAASKQDIIKFEQLQNEKQIRAIDLEHYNQVATDTPFSNSNYDKFMAEYLLDRINADDDIVAGIFHRPDTNGHVYGFSNEQARYVNSVRNANIYLQNIIDVLDAREKDYNEKWLVVVSADHGGSEKGHGMQINEHRTIWAASNYAIDNKYFSKNYNGFVEN